MRDAAHLRAQAKLCLEIARQMSDHTAAKNLRTEAARYQEEAAEAEASEQSARQHRGSSR